MSWWERQFYKLLTGNIAIGGDLYVTGTITSDGPIYRYQVFTFFT